jgi:proteasome accessory factor C
MSAPKLKRRGARAKTAPLTAAERIRRLLFLVPYVAAREDGVPVRELAERLGVGEDDVYAEVDLLCRVGPPAGDPSEFLLLTIERGRVIVDLPQHLVRPPRLSAQEAFALLLGAQALRGSGITHHEESLARAEAKIRRALGRSDAPALARIESDILLGSTDQAGLVVVPELARAARTRHAVDIDYYSAGRGRRGRRGVDPYGLINHLGAWYLVGRCHEHDEPRLFKCERIARVWPRADRFEVPHDFDLARFQRDRLRLPTVRRGSVTLRFSGEAAVQAAAWPEARRVGDEVEVALSMAPNEWLVGWILGFGADVTVLAPKELRETVRARLADIGQMHERLG